MKNIKAPPNKPVILYCGPIAKNRKASLGGYQTANLRAINILHELGYKVRRLYYPVGGSIPTSKKIIIYAIEFARIMLTLLFSKHRSAIYYTTPLFKQFIFFEILFCLIAKMRGMKIILDMRAGSQINSYKNRTKLYRIMFRKIVRLSNIISFEGEVYRDFVTAIAPNKPCFYLSNFVRTSEISIPPATRKMNSPKLVYVGFVSKDKGAIHAALTLKQLQKTYKSASLTLIGKVEEECINEIEKLNIEGITFTGSLEQTAIQKYLDKSHYFIFLTKWAGEGHSNSLTEAMARGCVPIYTAHGFNVSIVKNTGICIDDRENISNISNKIIENWHSDSYLTMSHDSAKRIFDNYTEVNYKQVLQKMLKSID